MCSPNGASLQLPSPVQPTSAGAAGPRWAATGLAERPRAMKRTAAKAPVVWVRTPIHWLAGSRKPNSRLAISLDPD
jgi:hypothetical protein